jgi:hypothetical protein
MRNVEIQTLYSRINELKWQGVLSELNSFLAHHNIQYWLDQGTLLGAYRDGAFLKNEHDVDFGILFKNVYPLLCCLPKLKEMGYQVFVHCTNITLIKFIDGAAYPVTFSVYQPIGCLYVHVDYVSSKIMVKSEPVVWYLYRLEMAYSVAAFRELNSWQTRYEMLIYKATQLRPIRLLIHKLCLKLWRTLGGIVYGFGTPKHFYNNLRQISFYGLQFNVPAKTDDYLTYKYGYDWRTPCSHWNVWVDDGGVMDVLNYSKRFGNWITLRHIWWGTATK